MISNIKLLRFYFSLKFYYLYELNILDNNFFLYIAIVRGDSVQMNRKVLQVLYNLCLKITLADGVHDGQQAAERHVCGWGGPRHCFQS